jgi:hypothetical protein
MKESSSLSSAAIFSAPVARGLPPNSFKGAVSREKFYLLRHDWINDIPFMPSSVFLIRIWILLAPQLIGSDLYLVSLIKDSENLRKNSLF